MKKITLKNGLRNLRDGAVHWQLRLLFFVALMTSHFGIAQTGTIGIGTGTATSTQMPIYSCYGYNYTQQIVTAAEFAAGGGVPGNITKIRFYYATTSGANANWNNWTVFLGHTAKTSFTSGTDWVPLANLTQVFSGVITPVEGNWFEMTFTAPFAYNGTSNLVVAVDENLAGWNCTAAFGAYTSAANTGIYYYSDGTNPDPAAPPTASGRTGLLARIQFEGAVASCLAPTALSGAVTSFTTANLAWTASQSLPADGYEYYYSTSNTAPDGTTVPSGTTAAGVTTAALSGLTPFTTYYFWVKSICSGTEESAWASGTFYTGYCTPAPSSIDAQGITNVTMGSINNTTGAEPGNYANYSAMSTTVGTGDTVNFSITYSTGYTYGTKIWVDWNNDVDFDDAGELVYTGLSAAPNPSTLSGSFLVPATASAGNHIIRIGGADNDMGPTNYCYTGAYGTFEDYTLNVVISSCVAPTALNSSAVTSTTATVGWTPPTSAPADGYEYYYNSTNVAPDAATTPSGSVGAGVLSADLTGLPAASLTYVWVRSVCGTGNVSSWAGPAIVNTTIAPGCASNPTPANGAVGVPVGPITLTWDVPTTGDAPTSYDLFVGNTAATVTTLVGNYPTNTTGAALVLNNYNAVVYWQVVPKNSGGSATGCDIWSFTTEAAPGYCLNAPNGQYPGGAAGYTPTTCDGIFVNSITTVGYAGEYSLINVTAGQTYQFMSSIATDFITISNAAGDTSYIAGTTPVTWVSTITGQVRFFTHVDDQCVSNTASRTRSIICGVVAVDAPDYANLQWPETITIVEGGSAAVYGQVYEPGLTDVAPNIDGQAPGIQAWIGISPEGENTDPATWTNWIVATHNAAMVGNNDEYTATIGATLDPGTYYYATRFRLNNGPFVYGGFDGGFWNGTTEVSGVLTVQAPPAPANDDCSGAVTISMDAATCDGSTNNGTNVGATDSGIAPATCFQYGENDVWFVFTTGPFVDTVDISTDFLGGTLIDTEIALYSGACGTLVEMDCDQDGGTTVLSNGFSWNSFIEDADVEENQTYYVRVSGYSADHTGSFCLKVSTGNLATGDFNRANLSVYPNPVKDILNLSHTQNITAVGIFNILGQEVVAKSINATEGQVDMSGLASGTYIVKVTANDVTTAIKVIKE